MFYFNQFFVVDDLISQSQNYHMPIFKNVTLIEWLFLYMHFLEFVFTSVGQLFWFRQAMFLNVVILFTYSTNVFHTICPIQYLHCHIQMHNQPTNTQPLSSQMYRILYNQPFKPIASINQLLLNIRRMIMMRIILNVFEWICRN